MECIGESEAGFAGCSVHHLWQKARGIVDLTRPSLLLPDNLWCSNFFQEDLKQCSVHVCAYRRDLTHFTKSIAFKIVSSHFSFLLSLQHIPEGTASIHLSYATFVGSQCEAQRGEASISWVRVWLALGWAAKHLYLEENLHHWMRCHKFRVFFIFAGIK